MLDSEAEELLAEIRQAAQQLRKGRRADALLIYHDVRQRAGPRAHVHYELGHLCEEIGDIDQAITHYVIAAEESPEVSQYVSTLGIACDLLARAKKFSSADEAFIRNTEKVLERGMPVQQRYCLHFALGKMHDDCGHYDEAFAHYQQANLLQKTNYDVGRDTRLLKHMKKVFNESTLKSFASLGHESAQPVFIVAMPRSAPL